MFNFFKKKIKTTKREDFQLILKDLYQNISIIHENNCNEIIHLVNQIPAKDKYNTQTFLGVQLYEMVYGYQITCLIGFASQEGLINIMDNLELKKILLNEISDQSGFSRESIEEIDEFFLDCRGDINCLSEEFYNKICEVCNIDQNSDSYIQMINIFKKKSITLAIETQKATAEAFGSSYLVQELDKVLKNY